MGKSKGSLAWRRLRRKEWKKGTRHWAYYLEGMPQVKAEYAKGSGGDMQPVNAAAYVRDALKKSKEQGAIDPFEHLRRR